MNKLIIALAILVSFGLGMTIAYYKQFMADPPEHYAIQSRALNYTDKDCYTKSDVQLIVFGKVLYYD